eukprot:PhF_6_TR29850/c0_g1_i1/m.43806
MNPLEIPPPPSSPPAQSENSLERFENPNAKIRNHNKSNPGATPALSPAASPPPLPASLPPPPSSEYRSWVMLALLIEAIRMLMFLYFLIVLPLFGLFWEDMCPASAVNIIASMGLFGVAVYEKNSLANMEWVAVIIAFIPIETVLCNVSHEPWLRVLIILRLVSSPQRIFRFGRFLSQSPLVVRLVAVPLIEFGSVLAVGVHWSAAVVAGVLSVNYGEGLMYVITTLTGSGGVWGSQAHSYLIILKIFLCLVYVMLLVIMLQYMYHTYRTPQWFQPERLVRTKDALEELGMPPDLCSEALQFAQHIRTSSGGVSEYAMDMLEELPAVLQRSLSHHVSTLLIKRADLFTTLTHELRTYLSARVAKETAFPGEVIVKQGAPGSALYFLVYGVCSVSIQNDVQVAELGIGDFFGEMALFSPQSLRSATVTAITFVELMRLDREHMGSFHQKFPEIVAAIQKEATRRTEELNEKRASTSSPDAPSSVPAIQVSAPGHGVAGTGAVALFFDDDLASSRRDSNRRHTTFSFSADLENSRRTYVSEGSSESMGSPLLSMEQRRALGLTDFDDYDIRYSISSSVSSKHRNASGVPVVDDRLVQIAMENHVLLKEIMTVLAPFPKRGGTAGYRRGTYQSNVSGSTESGSTNPRDSIWGEMNDQSLLQSQIGSNTVNNPLAAINESGGDTTS